MTRIPAAVATVLLLLAGCGGSDPNQVKGKPRDLRFPVEVAPVATREVRYQVTAVGAVDAFETVRITARVAGVVEKVAFAEGDAVGADQVLVEIDPQRFRIAFASARAAVARAQSAKNSAETSLQRRELLAAKEGAGLISEEDMQTVRAKVGATRADLEQAQAAQAQAELDLRDALVRAPLAGVIQTRTVQTGQYVQAGVELATMLRRDPLLLRFRVPEGEAGRLQPGQKLAFTVTDDTRAWSAVISHVAAGADPLTRLVAVVANVDDAERARLRPGAFAQATIPIGMAQPALVAPQTAVRASDKGFVAYVVEEAGGKALARERVLKLGMRTADGQVEVRSGLAAGERLVVTGAEALKADCEVLIDGGKTAKPAQ
jgi:multidrug efflux system membrane fusion protein